MAKSNGKSRGLPHGRFAGIPIAVMETRKFRKLSAWAVRLLLELSKQFTGYNNGDLCAAWSLMRARGFRSKGTLDSSVRELLDAGFIMLTRQGGRHQPNLYAVTWACVDECKDSRTRTHKLDVRPTKVAPSLWHDPR